MRTTLTIDDDVAIRLKKQQEADATSLKEAVNTALRRGLEAMEQRAVERAPYSLQPTGLGKARIPIDSIADALASAEGDTYG